MTSRTRASSIWPAKSFAVRRSWSRVLSIRMTSAVRPSLPLMACVSRLVSSSSSGIAALRRGHDRGACFDAEAEDDYGDTGGDGDDAERRNVGDDAHHWMG